MTLFASYNSVVDAERAAAALLDRGARNEDLSVVAHEGQGAMTSGHAEDVAKHGVTTTTGADSAMGAAKGLSIGMGVGMLGVLAALLVPGVGLIVGAGALATALAGTAVAGATAGGIVGYLKDQGMGDEVAAQYHARVAAGGAILSLSVPSGDLSEIEAESLLVKYGAVGVFTSYPTTTQDVAPLPVSAPHVVPSEPLESLRPISTPPVVALTGDLVVATPVITVTDPVTGLATQGYVDDLTTGLRRPVRFDDGRAYYDVGLPAHPIPVVALGSETVILSPSSVGAEVPVAAVTPTQSDPVSGLAIEGYVEDPVTGLRRPVRFEHGRAYYVG